MATAVQDPLLRHRHRYSVDDYYRMADVGILRPDSRVELIDGEVIEMPPIGPLHASIVTELQNRLIKAVGDAAIVRVQNPVRLGPGMNRNRTWQWSHSPRSSTAPDTRSHPTSCC